MLLLAAGERVEDPITVQIKRAGLTREVALPEFLKFTDLQTSLSHQCRQTIRKQLLKVDTHAHLFGRVARLGLPKLLASYLLYDSSTAVGDASVLNARRLSRASSISHGQ